MSKNFAHQIAIERLDGCPLGAYEYSASVSNSTSTDLLTILEQVVKGSFPSVSEIAAAILSQCETRLPYPMPDFH